MLFACLGVSLLSLFYMVFLVNEVKFLKEKNNNKFVLVLFFIIF